MKNKNGIVLLGIVALFAMVAVTATASAQPAENMVWFEPEDSSVPGYCNTIEVEVWANITNSSGCAGGTLNITYDPGCANVTNWELNMLAFQMGTWDTRFDGREWITFMTLNPQTGEVLIETLTIHCKSTNFCTTSLTFIEGSSLRSPPPSKPFDVEWKDGTFTCESEEKPDLVVEKSVEFNDDGKFVVSYTVTNIGGGDAGPSTTCKYVDGVLQESQLCPALAPEASHDGEFNPEECPCGETLNVTVCADNDNDVDESDETNNCEVNLVECPYIEVDIRADGIASNIFNVAGYMICPGTVTEDGVTIDNETAMGALVIYCQNNGINVQITIGTWGEYVVQIGNDPADNNSWSYAVNEEVPPVGGAQKVIVDGDRVHWYNNNLHYYEVLTALDKTAIYVGETLTATVTWKNIAGTDFLNGASVNVGAMGPWGPDPGPSVGTTGVDGTCTFPWSTVGTWGVYAVDPVHGSGIYNYPPVTFTCSTEEKPDLVVNKTVSFSDSTFTVNYTVSNIGTALANESTTCKYVDSELMEHQACPTLNPGESYNGSFNLEPCPCGSILNVTVCADNDDVVNESDETNNCEVNFVDCPPCKPDLTVTEITVNYNAPDLGGLAIGPEPGPGVHTECNNLSAVIEEDNGVDVLASFDVTFKVDGTTLCTVRVPGLTGGANKTVYCNCSWYPYAGDDFAINVTVDSNNEILESDETNNTKWNNGTAVSNGYKGDGWQGPDKNLENVQCHDQDTINLIYSVGDSEYVSGSTQWTEYAGSWTTDDLPVPDGAEIEKAMLYVYYTWDKDTVMPNNVNMAFNGNNIALARDYSDSKGFGDYDFPSGMLVYNVLNNFAATGPNNAILTKAVAADVVSMRGMLLMVVYNHPDEPERMICIDEGYDMLYAKDSYAVTSEEATTYAPFTCCEPVPVEEIGKATLIAVAPSASDGDDMNRLSFNDGLWPGAWSGFAGSTELGIAEKDVLCYLKEEDNVANFQDQGDWMDASNAFLILETSYPTGEATDPTGNTKDVYTTAETVYATGSGFVPNSLVNIYITEDKHWIDGMTINSTVYARKDNVSTDTNGNIVGEEMWPNPIPGEYDMVFDANQNGLNDVGIDAIDDPNDPGFTVLGQVPALTPIGIAALVSLLSLVAMSTILRSKRKKR